MIAVCFLTCGPDRLEVAARTAESFAHHHRGRDDLTLLHVDGGGPGRVENIRIAKSAGFATAWAPIERVGQIESFRFFLDGAGDFDLLLWLENDWETERQIPPLEFFQGFPGIEQFRLYGERKMKGDGPRALAGRHRIGTKIPIAWQCAPAIGWQVARAHWGAGGTIVRPEALARHAAGPRLKDVIVSANDLLSMRPFENYLWHIGEKTTAGFFG
jgi:hypothetical protein